MIDSGVAAISFWQKKKQHPRFWGHITWGWESTFLYSLYVCHTPTKSFVHFVDVL